MIFDVYLPSLHFPFFIEGESKIWVCVVMAPKPEWDINQLLKKQNHIRMKI